MTTGAVKSHERSPIDNVPVWLSSSCESLSVDGSMGIGDVVALFAVYRTALTSQELGTNPTEAELSRFPAASE